MTTICLGTDLLSIVHRIHSVDQTDVMFSVILASGLGVPGPVAGLLQSQVEETDI